MRYEKSLAIRVILTIVILALPLIGLNIVDMIMQKPTIWLSYIPIKILGYPISVEGNLITLGENTLRFISACTATSAYYLLAILILLTKDMGLKRGMKIFIAGALLILLMNIVRIDILLIVLAEKGVNMFTSLHLVFWEFVSSLYVAAVWIFLVKKFRIKNIPAITDIKELYKKTKRKH
ncbi:MAG: pacearchaeosortase [archaeon]